MLTNEDLARDKATCELRTTTDPEFAGFYTRIMSAIDELLTLREAVAPQMAEVDACLYTPKPYQKGDTIVYSATKYDGPGLAEIARTAILAHEQEKQRADEADARYDRFVSEWFEEDADYQRLVDAAESHIDPDCWLAKECQRIHKIFLKRFEEEEQQND